MGDGGCGVCVCVCVGGGGHWKCRKTKRHVLIFLGLSLHTMASSLKRIAK